MARICGLPTKPAWLKLALSDARLDKPMSLKRENRMRAALGLDVPRKRKPYWRPCLPIELSQTQRDRVCDLVATMMLEDDTL